MVKTTIKAIFLAVLIGGAFVQANPLFFSENYTIITAASASDNFNSYADGVSLGDQTNWAVSTGDFVIDKVMTEGTCRSATAANCCVRRTSPVFSANQESELTIKPGINAGNIGPAVRIQSGAATFYEAHWDASGGTLYLASVSANSWTEITSTAKVYVTGDKIRLEATGAGTATRLTVKEDTGSGWVAVFTSVNPATDIDGGQPGIYGFGDEGDTQLHCDVWAAADL